MSMCDKCQLQYCTDCIDTQTSDNVIVLSVCNYVMLCTQVAHSDIVLIGQLNRKKICVVQGGYPGCQPSSLMAFRILHDVLCEGKVVCKSS